MKGLHISVTCAALFVIVALVAYHLGGAGKCREGFREGEVGVAATDDTPFDAAEWFDAHCSCDSTYTRARANENATKYIAEQKVEGPITQPNFIYGAQHACKAARCGLSDAWTALL